MGRGEGGGWGIDVVPYKYPGTRLRTRVGEGGEGS